MARHDTARRVTNTSVEARKIMFRPAVALIAFVAVTGFVLAPRNAHGQTVIEVSQEVIRSSGELEPLGVNNFGGVGGTKYTAGNLITNAGFEPVRIRDLYRVIESGQENGRCWITLDGPGTSKWLTYTTGTYSGAKMRVYRFVDADGQPLPYKDVGWAQGGKILDATNGDACVPLFTTTVLPKGTPGFPDGGWLAPSPAEYAQWQKMSSEDRAEWEKKWRVYYEADEPLRMDDVVIFERSFAWPDPADFHPRMVEKGAAGTWTDVTGTSTHVSLPDDAPAEMMGGHGALEVTPADGVAELWHKIFGGTGRSDASWYGTLEEGVTYRYEAWVTETGATGGEITLGFGGNRPGSVEAGYFGDKSTNESFAAPATWTRIGYEFTAPQTPPNGGIEGAIIRYRGTGKLLVDNVKLQPVYEPGDADKPFVVYRKLFNTLMENQPATGRKGAARVWFGLNFASMESLCNWNAESGLRLFAGVAAATSATNMTLPKALTYLEATGDAPETRMVPWIITQVTHTEEEYQQLVEYLAAPYDPATDTPQSKPMAYKRVRQRGHNRPWTDDFRELIIEYGNENWHNRAMADWIGMGRAGTVHQAGREYGLWGKHMTEVMKDSPYWNGDKIHICFGGNYSAGVAEDGSVSGYGQEATVAADGINDYHGHATYIGPRWETGESSQSTIDDNGVQKTLFAYHMQKEEEWTRQQAADERLREMGLDVRMVAYEGGPSGFGLRAKTPEEDRAGEYYGKSYAMGTAILDAWLDAWAKGWTYQCYLSFGQGRWWNSHTSISQGHRPSPGWLAQTMINRTMSNRDMLAVKVTGAPALAVELPRSQGEIRNNQPVRTKDIPIIYAHAMGDANYLAVAVVNLDLSRAQAVALKLPMESATRITRHYMDGGPRDTNLDELKVTLASRNVDSADLRDGDFRAQIAPGSGVIFVFEK